MRSIGLKNAQVSTVYVVEGVSVVLAASLLGATVGAAVSLLVNLQAANLLETALDRIQLNYFNPLIVFVLGLLSAAQGARGALAKLKHN